jgi:hypothetical protein
MQLKTQCADHLEDRIEARAAGPEEGPVEALPRQAGIRATWVSSFARAMSPSALAMKAASPVWRCAATSYLVAMVLLIDVSPAGRLQGAERF